MIPIIHSAEAVAILQSTVGDTNTFLEFLTDSQNVAILIGLPFTKAMQLYNQNVFILLLVFSPSLFFIVSIRQCTIYDPCLYLDDIIF